MRLKKIQLLPQSHTSRRKRAIIAASQPTVKKTALTLTIIRATPSMCVLLKHIFQ